MSENSEKVQVNITDEDSKKDDALIDAEGAGTGTEENGGKAALQDEVDLAAKLDAAEKQSRDYYDRLLRLSAEFDNYKKRTSREMRDVVKYANEKLFKELLSVVDNLERAIDAASNNASQDDPLLQGVNLTLNETLKLLERHSVVPVKAMGELFDPTYHQAMLQEEDDEKPENTVIREMQKGYLIHDRLLRPAMVGVSKKKNAGDEGGQSD